MPDTPAAPCHPLFALTPGLELVLASASPRRRQFLAEWGLPFRLVRPTGEEPRPGKGESPTAYTERAATAKARAVVQSLGQGAESAPGTGAAPAHSIILAADTVVAVDNDILGKPENPAHALRMLERLAGRGHEVISAVCLLLPLTPAAPDPEKRPEKNRTKARAERFQDFRQLVFCDVSRVFFHPWPRRVLQAYVDTGEPDDKAGAYAIQGQGAVLVERVEGSWSTVVGLPVTPLAQMLLDEGLMLPVSRKAT